MIVIVKYLKVTYVAKLNDGSYELRELALDKSPRTKTSQLMEMLTDKDEQAVLLVDRKVMTQETEIEITL